MWPFRFAMHGKRGLRMMVVSLLSSSPKNGVEIMDGVEAMTRGWWRPSPGSVYPLLDKMKDEGTVRKREDGRYELTPKAHTELEVSFGPRFRRPYSPDGVVSELKGIVSYMEDMEKSGKQHLLPSISELEDVTRRLADIAKRNQSPSGEKENSS